MMFRRVTIASLAAAGLFGAVPPKVGPAPLEIEPAAIQNPNQSPIQRGASGSAVVRAQILLDRAHFSCGQIDGYFGTNLQKTVAAFQQARSLPVNGEVDAPTWQMLNRDQAPLLTNYSIQENDLKGPFIKQIPKNMDAQAKLPSMGYTSPEQELSERFHESQQLLQALNPGANFAAAGQRLTVPNVVTMPPAHAARVVVSKSESSVRAYDADGRLLSFYVATIGSEHDPLPIGNWKILSVTRDPYFHYNPNLFWDAKPSDSKVTIKPGPNNPVGQVWMDLSKEHYGIHGTPDPSLIGHTFSHGCIRLTNWDALELASMVAPGVPVILKE